MIYPDSITANMLATKLQETNGAAYTVTKVTLGYQVVKITPCPAYMPPAKPLPYPGQKLYVAPTKNADNIETVILHVKIIRETATELRFAKNLGDKPFIHKSHVISRHPGPLDTSYLVVSKKTALARGWIKGPPDPTLIAAIAPLFEQTNHLTTAETFSAAAKSYSTIK
jgi:hypothetical protein